MCRPRGAIPASARTSPAIDADEFERPLQSGGADAGNKISEDGMLGGQNAAPFTAGVSGAGHSVGQSAAAAFIAASAAF
ncbi:hypothetical protein [Mesorhizobium sp. 43Arga]